MTKNIFILFVIFTLCSCPCIAQQNKVEQKLNELGIVLPAPSKPFANYVKAVRTGNLVFLAGHGPTNSDGTDITGKVGTALSIQQGYDAARSTAINMLVSLKAEIGDLNKVKRIVKV